LTSSFVSEPHRCGESYLASVPLRPLREHLLTEC
jgi:hypothetical protein